MKSIFDNSFSFITQKPTVCTAPDEVLGIRLWSEEVITFEDIYEQMNDSVLKFSDEDYNYIKTAAQKKLSKKKFDDDYMQLIAAINYPDIKKGDPIPQEVVSDVLNSSKSPKLNKEKLSQDWIKSKQNFKFAVDENFQYWKIRCLKLRGEKHE